MGNVGWRWKFGPCWLWLSGSIVQEGQQRVIELGMLYLLVIDYLFELLLVYDRSVLFVAWKSAAF